MKNSFLKEEIKRREFLKKGAAGVFLSLLDPFSRLGRATAPPTNKLFWVKSIPNNPFYSGEDTNHHAGIDCLLNLMGKNGLKFYRSTKESILGGAQGMIAPDDVVLVKVNAQWKYRGCTNSDLVRGLIQKVLEHPDIFKGEVVIFENGQGRGSLNCDTSALYSDSKIHANANDPSQSFLYLVNKIFKDHRVSAYLLDPIRTNFIDGRDHTEDGYRIYENVSYPCFTTARGNRVELQQGIWKKNKYYQNLKLINIPVLKHHDHGGSEITASLKHFYGVVSMGDGQSALRHYGGLGDTCGKMVASVRTPVLNILDAIWVSFSSLTGYPSSTTSRANQILASQDPVALDYWAAKYILYPIDNNIYHRPDYPGIDIWLRKARDIINGRGGLYNPESGIFVRRVTKSENRMQAFIDSARRSGSPPTRNNISEG